MKAKDILLKKTDRIYHHQAYIEKILKAFFVILDENTKIQVEIKSSRKGKNRINLGEH